MKGIYAIKVALKQFSEIIKTPEGRTFLKLCFFHGDRKRFSKGIAKVGGHQIHYVDAMSFLWQYWEIFVKKYYQFETDKADPVVIDCGANIGMASLFFKEKYPKCKLIAYEADPTISNIYLSNIKGEKIFFNKAVWINDRGVFLKIDGGDTGAISQEGEISVDSISLKNELSKFGQIDLLKIDVEGAEHEIIPDIKDELWRVKNLFLEYHDRKDGDQLGKIISILEEVGFRYIISNESHYMKAPLDKIDERSMQVNIFAKNHKL